MYFHVYRSCLVIVSLSAMSLTSSIASGQDEPDATDLVQRVIQLRSEGETLPTIAEKAVDEITISPLDDGPMVSFDAIDSSPKPQINLDLDLSLIHI